MNIKDYIKTRRIELNLSQLDVANQVGVSEATVSRWESGDIANMGASRITALAKVLKTSPLLILGENPQNYENSGQFNTSNYEDWLEKNEPAELTLDQLADIKKIVTLYQSASPEKKKLVEDLLNLAEQEKYNSDDD